MVQPKPLRLVALPLTKPIQSNQDRGLLYLHSILPSDAVKPVSYMTRVTNWAGSQWDKLGKAPVTNWKHRVFEKGNSLLDNIEFEEWSLKGLDKDLGPDLWPIKSGDTTATQAGKANVKVEAQGLVPLLYPSKYLDEAKLRQYIIQFLEQREPFHRKWLWRNLILSPLTWPFAIIPIVPNFPLFWVLWRAWSHWRAATSSKYLLDLFHRDQIKLQPSNALNDILDKRPSDSLALLTEPQVEDLVNKLSLSAQAELDFRRAVVQAEARIREFQREQDKDKQQ